MSNKTCPTCQKTFNNKTNYTYHMKRQKPYLSPELANNRTPPEKKFKCERCEATFQTKQNLVGHLNRQKPCEIKDPTEEEIELRLLFEQLKAEHLHQQEENGQSEGVPKHFSVLPGIISDIGFFCLDHGVAACQ